MQIVLSDITLWADDNTVLDENPGILVTLPSFAGGVWHTAVSIKLPLFVYPSFDLIFSLAI